MYVVDQKEKAGALNKVRIFLHSVCPDTNMCFWSQMEQVYNGYIEYILSPQLQSQLTARDYWEQLDSQSISEGTIVGGVWS